MNPADLFSSVIRSVSPNLDVTWVGPNPFVKGLCLGFDDGTIILTNTAQGHWTEPQVVSPAREAINGVAAIGKENLAVSTRSDVTFIELAGKTNTIRTFYPGGAHGIEATQSGCFVVPLGAKGLLLARPETGIRQDLHLVEGTEGQLYFYRVAALHDIAGKEMLVFANRRNGVGLSEFKGADAKRSVHTLTFEGLDVVDVCGVAAGSLSAIAISPKAEVLWLKDTSMQIEPLAMRLGGVEGQVYRVLATRQHLFVLTSTAFYFWANLVGKVLFNEMTVPETHRLFVEAVDMSLYDDEYVLLVMATNDIVALKISDLANQSSNLINGAELSGNTIEMSRTTEVEDFAPDWHRHDVQQALMAESTTMF
jgi:hypothetical protein